MTVEAQTTPQRVGRWVLGLVLIGQGVNHFIMTDVMVRMMPAALPAHRELVWLSGIAEIALGLLAMRPQTRVLAGWGILALLVAVFPANLNMALEADGWSEIPSWGLWARLPFQLLFGWWAWTTCIARRP